jgi:hypothetical protein
MVGKKRGHVRSLYDFPLKNHRGQVTIFIIIGIIIVAGSLLIYSFYPKIKTTLGIEESTPQSYIQSCIEDEIKNAVDVLSIQGGSVNPELYSLYQDEKIEYLCYTNEFYASCIVQQPMLKTHIELEIKNEIEDEVESCFNSLKSSYEGKGYSVDMKTGNKKIELLPQKILSSFNYSFTLTKGSDVQKYDSFSVVMNNNLYELVGIANSIIEWESFYGDAETTMYMTYYPNLKVEKILRSSGNKIYIITDRKTGNKFQFAIQGQIWPAGYVNPTLT